MESRVLPGTTPNLISVRNPHEHAARRRPWQRAMATECVRGYEPTIAKRALQLVSKFEMAAQKDEEVDLAQWIGYFTFDFMGDMA